MSMCICVCLLLCVFKESDLDMLFYVYKYNNCFKSIVILQWTYQSGLVQDERGFKVYRCCFFYWLWLRVYSGHTIRRVPFWLPLSNCVTTILISMVILLSLLKWFHHMDTILLVLLVCLNITLYLKLLNWMRAINIVL